ncbi:MAG: superoxide dismutase family protein [Spongiibacteraceae bacterium]|nr:superoxide dismutase family protein [Spongiibacteraceae bacterium]
MKRSRAPGSNHYWLAAVITVLTATAWGQSARGPDKETPFGDSDTAGQAQYSVVMQRVDGEREEAAVLGRITLRADASGLRILPQLEGLPAGDLALQLHSKADCGTTVTADVHGPGDAAGPRHAPEEVTDGNGGEARSVGDLPPLSVDDQGRAVMAVTASHVRLEDVVGRSLLIYDGADPAQATRFACGIIRN